jgi:hypothetical protein
MASILMLSAEYQQQQSLQNYELQVTNLQIVNNLTLIIQTIY